MIEPRIKDNNLISLSKYFLKKVTSGDYVIVAGFVILCLVIAVITTTFLTGENISNVARQSSIIAIVSAGTFLVMAAGGLDISVGSMVGLTSIVFAKFLVDFSTPWPIAMLIAVAVGILCGAFNGFLVVNIKIIPLIATLGTMYIFRGIILVITGSMPINNIPPSVAWVGRGYVGAVPIPVIIMFAIFAIVFFISEKTRYGRFVFATGGNKEASRLSGINTKQISVSTYIIGGILCAVSGIIITSRLNSGQPMAGNTFEFEAIIACTLGGCSMQGGRGKAITTLIGALFVTVLINGMTLMNISSYYQQIIKGVVLILTLALDVVRNPEKY